MSSSQKIIWIVFGLFLILMLIAQFKTTYTYQSTVNVQGNSQKAYDYLASHEWKRPMLDPIDPKNTVVEDFEVGNKTIIDYKGGKIFTEEPVELISGQKIVWNQRWNNLYINGTIDFEQNFRSTNLVISESIKVKSIWLKSIFFYFPKSLKTIRNAAYQRFKELIESSPDKTVKPNEFEELED